jgi:hypothetical protein
MTIPKPRRSTKTVKKMAIRARWEDCIGALQPLSVARRAG